MSDQTSNTASQPRRVSFFEHVGRYIVGILAAIGFLTVVYLIWSAQQREETMVVQQPAAQVLAPQPQPAAQPTTVVQTSTSSAVDPMIATLRTELAVYGWTQAEVDAIVAAYQAGAVSTKRVQITTDSRGWYDPAGTWASPYAPRWSEANLVAHLRDEHPQVADLMVIEANGRRYSILWDGCGTIEKIAIGVKPVEVKVVVRKVYVQKPHSSPGRTAIVLDCGCD